MKSCKYSVLVLSPNKVSFLLLAWESRSTVVVYLHKHIDIYKTDDEAKSKQSSKEGTTTFLELLDTLVQMDSNFSQLKIDNLQLEQQRYAFRKKIHLAVLSDHI